LLGEYRCSTADEWEVYHKSQQCTAAMWGIAREAGHIDLILSSYSLIGHYNYEQLVEDQVSTTKNGLVT
jgi:hypothetical protein